jgi:ADP-heptose:LPS heptosyltransferase
MRLHSSNLLGDTLLQTPAIRSWKKANPDLELEYHCSSERGAHLLLQGNPYIDKLVVDSDAPVVSDYNPFIEMDASVAFTLGASNNKSLSWGYGHMVGVEIDSLAYDYVVTGEEWKWADYKLMELEKDTKGVVLIGRHSASCTSNDPGVRVANKCVSNRFWVQVANWLLSEGYLPVAVGSQKDADDTRYRDWPGQLLYGENIRNIAALARSCEAVLTVDNGLRHLTAAAGGNLFCISGRIPLFLIQCEPVLPGQIIHEVYKELPFVTAATIIEGAQKVLI